MVDPRRSRAAQWAAIVLMTVLSAALALEAHARAVTGDSFGDRVAPQANGREARLSWEPESEGSVRAMGLLTSTTTASPSPGPSPSPTKCPEWYVIRVHIFPDHVGNGFPDQPCSGCDGYYSKADMMAAGYCLLDPAWVVVHMPGQPENVIAQQVMRRKDNALDMVHLFYVCQPPPHEVRVVTTNMRCLRLCPNFSDTRLIEQDDYDRSYGSNYAKEAFPFWSCALPGGTPTASPSAGPLRTPTSTMTPATTSATTPSVTATRPTRRPVVSKTPLPTATPTSPPHVPTVITDTPSPSRTATATEPVIAGRVWLPYSAKTPR